MAKKRAPKKLAKRLRRLVTAPKKKKKKKKLESIGYTQGLLQ